MAPTKHSDTDLPTDIKTGERIPIDAVLRKHNLSIDDLIKCGREGLLATRIVRDRFGDVVAEDPDNATRHKFFASFLELLGYMKKDSVNVQVVNISAEEKELLDAYKRKVGVE